MKFFAFALLIAAVAAEDAARSARSVIGWGGVHGLGLVAAPAIVSHAPVAVAAAPAVIPVGLGLGHGSLVHGIHRRSVVGVAPGLVGVPALGHGVAVGHGIGLGHGIGSPILAGPVLASPLGHGGLIRHGRSIIGAHGLIGAPAVVGAHGLVGAPIASVAAVPAIGIGHGLVGHGLVGHGIPIHG